MHECIIKIASKFTYCTTHLYRNTKSRNQIYISSLSTEQKLSVYHGLYSLGHDTSIVFKCILINILLSADRNHFFYSYMYISHYFTVVFFCKKLSISISIPTLFSVQWSMSNCGLPEYWTPFGYFPAAASKLHAGLVKQKPLLKTWPWRGSSRNICN